MTFRLLFVAICVAFLNGIAHAEPQAEVRTLRLHIDELAGLIDARYLDPAMGRRYAQALRDNASKGAYDRLFSKADLAARLTADLQAIHPDIHLQVLPFDGSIPPPEAAAPANAPPPDPIERADWAAPGIADISFLSLGVGDAATQPVDSFMKEHKGARALIIDLRRCRGGTPIVFEDLASYFVAVPSHSITMDMRFDAATPQFQQIMGASSSIRHVDAESGIVRTEEWIQPRAATEHWPRTPVYILTSHQTVSAAEHMAFAFRLLKLATIVGETTAGGGHFGGIIPFAGGQMSVFVPWGRAYDPATGKDWEGTGVVPDISVPADEALARAIQFVNNGH